MNDIFTLRAMLEKADVVAAKEVITQLWGIDSPCGVLYFFCLFAKRDDPQLLHECIKNGAHLELESAGKRLSPLHHAANNRHPKSTRLLLDLGVPVDIEDGLGNTALTFLWTNLCRLAWFQGNTIECAKVLIDAGARILPLKTMKTNWVLKFLASRDCARAASIAILGLVRCRSDCMGQNGKDVLVLIARCVWESRGTESPQSQ